MTAKTAACFPKMLRPGLWQEPLKIFLRVPTRPINGAGRLWHPPAACRGQFVPGGWKNYIGRLSKSDLLKLRNKSPMN